MIVGVDLGNYAVKTSEKVHFVNKITEEESFENSKSISIDGKKFFINDNSEFSIEYDKSQKQYLIPTLYYALASSSKCNVFDVVVGLPIQQYNARKDALKTTIAGNNAKTVILNSKERREIYIRNIEVAPEGASCIYNLKPEIRSAILNRNLIIIDIGGGTTEVCAIKNGSKIGKVKTINLGTINVYSDIVNYVNQLYTTNFTTEYGEDIIKYGLFLNGHVKDNSFVKPCLKANFDKLWNKISIDFEINNAYVYLTGGGSLIFKQPFKNRLQDSLILSENSIYDNANGFSQVGVMKWGM